MVFARSLTQPLLLVLLYNGCKEIFLEDPSSWVSSRAVIVKSLDFFFQEGD